MLLGGLASGARGWVAGCARCLGVLPPWGVIAVAAPGAPGAPNLHFCDLGVKYNNIGTAQTGFVRTVTPFHVLTFYIVQS